VTIALWTIGITILIAFLGCTLVGAAFIGSLLVDEFEQWRARRRDGAK
jgi:hypothetical protein